MPGRNRAWQAAIDLALHLVAREHLGMPQNSADAFKLLSKAGLITERTALTMVAMTGFRNVVVHEYQGVDMNVVRAIAQEHWKSLVSFCAEVGGGATQFMRTWSTRFPHCAQSAPPWLSTRN